MVYILQRFLVDDVEEAQRFLAATAPERRRRGVAREHYLTDPRRPHELIVAYDGEDLELLRAAIHPGEQSYPAAPPPERPRPDVATRLLHALRVERGVSIRGLAQRTGLTQWTIYAIETRRIRPRPGVTRRLAAALGVTPREIDAGWRPSP
jgi:DNA-binding XRE family transcriptional regulator